MTSAVHNIIPNDAPDFISILLCCMLFKLGGQITLSLGEINDIHSQFPSIRFALSKIGDDPRDEQLTATLRSLDHVDNDRPNDPYNTEGLGRA